MPKRTLGVLGVAAFAGLALPFGMPTVTQASSSLAPIASITLSPLPIAPAGSLTANTSVAMCVAPKDANGDPIGVGVGVYLSFYSGLFTPAPGTHTSTAFVGATALTQTPTLFHTAATCSFAGGTAADAIAVVYTSPNPTIPSHGRDVLIAADSAADSGSTGVCPVGAGNLCNNGTYVYSPVTQYVFNAVPIALAGTLVAGHPVTFDVTAEDVTSNPVPEAFVNLALNSTASPEGTATGFNSFDNRPKVKITNSAQRFGTNNAGVVPITYTPSAATSGTDTITAQDRTSSPTFSSTTSYTYGSIVAPTMAPYTPVAPFRVCDTRPAGPGVTANQCDAVGQGPIQPGQSRLVNVTRGGVPSTATAIVVNLTAIAPTQGTKLTVFPGGGSLPGTSNINPQAGQVRAVLVEVGIGTSGNIAVNNVNGTINVALDVEGYVDSTSTGLYNPVAPTRICDTRAAGGGVPVNQCNGKTIGPGGVLSFVVSDAASGSPIPTSGVTAVVFNLTAIAPTIRTAVTAYPGDLIHTPGVSNINAEAGQAVPNRVVVPVPASCTGAACVVKIGNSAGNVNVAVDVDGWFGPATGSQFTALPSPARICDTRFGGNAQGCATPGKIGPGGVLTIDVDGIDGIPAVGTTHAPLALVANVTAVDATTGTFVTVYPGNIVSVPNASDINVSPTFPYTNLVVVGVDPATGNINLYNKLGSVDLIVDVFGYYSN
jgi:hypothetical protein